MSQLKVHAYVFTSASLRCPLWSTTMVNRLCRIGTCGPTNAGEANCRGSWRLELNRASCSANQGILPARTKRQWGACCFQDAIMEIWMTKPGVSKGPQSQTLNFSNFLSTLILRVILYICPCYFIYLFFQMHRWINLLFAIWESHRTAVLVVFTRFDLSFASVAVRSCDTDMCAGTGAAWIARFCRTREFITSSTRLRTVWFDVEKRERERERGRKRERGVPTSVYSFFLHRCRFSRLARMSVKKSRGSEFMDS